MLGKNGGRLTSQESWWNPEGRVPGMPGMPEVPGPNPQSCDTDCSQSREWDHQGCLGHFQEGQGVDCQVLGPRRVILGCFHNSSIVDLPLVESIYGLSVVGFESLHCILTQ